VTGRTGSPLDSTAALYSLRRLLPTNVRARAPALGCVYDRAVASPAIVELARTAVRRLAAAEATANDALDALDRIERVGLGPPYTIALAGDPAARAALLDWLAGDKLFDPARREPDRIVLTLRRGPVTALRARRRDGSVEHRAFDGRSSTAPAEPDEPGEHAPAAPGAPEPAEGAAGREGSGRAAGARRAARQSDADASRSEADRAQTVRASDRPAFRDAIVLSAEAETTALVRTPPWWAVWRRVAMWWRAWRMRRAQARSAALPAPGDDTAAASAGSPAAAAPPPPPPAPARRGFAKLVARGKQLADPRRAFADAITACLADDTVERLFIDVAGGTLPDRVVVIELPSHANARSLEAIGADACLVACGAGGFAMTDQLETALTIVPHVFAVAGGAARPREPRVRSIASLAALPAAMSRIAMIERALAVGAQAVAALAAGAAVLDLEIGRAERGFRARIERLEAKRIPSASYHISKVLDELRPAIVEDAARLLDDAVAVLHTAITELAAAWAAQLGEASSAEALRGAAAQVDEESLAKLRAAQATARGKLSDGLTAHVRARYDALVGELRRDTDRDDPPPDWLHTEIEIIELDAGTELGSVAPRLTSLFRSRDKLRGEAAAQLTERIAALRELATARLRDTERKLEPAVTGALAIALRAELERHETWVEAQLTRERVAIEAERAELTRIARIREAALADEREISSALDMLAAELP